MQTPHPDENAPANMQEVTQIIQLISHSILSRGNILLPSLMMYLLIDLQATNYIPLSGNLTAKSTLVTMLFCHSISNIFVIASATFLSQTRL